MSRIRAWLTEPVPVPTVLTVAIVAYLLSQAIPNAIWIINHLTR